MPFIANVLQKDRWTLVLPLMLLGAGVLAGCPQLLEDDFGTTSRAIGPDVGERICSTPQCVPTSGDTLGGPLDLSGGDAGAPDSPDGPDASPDDSAVPPDAGGATTPTPDASTAADCRIIALNDSTHSSSDNCLGIYGWNDSVPDTGSSITQTYVDGRACFSGHVATSGWGVAFNFSFANNEDWDAAAHGVTGLEFTGTGPLPPPELRVFFTDNSGDTCHIIEPVGAVSVPFTSAHPDCTSSSGRTPDVSTLSYMALTMQPQGAAYDFDFCLQIRALP